MDPRVRSLSIERRRPLFRQPFWTVAEPALVFWRRFLISDVKTEKQRQNGEKMRKTRDTAI